MPMLIHGESWWNDTDMGKQKKNLSQCHFVEHTFHVN
jgi:hypothetical protein